MAYKNNTDDDGYTSDQPYQIRNDRDQPLTEEEELYFRLDLLGLKLSKSRAEAIGGRQDSGIEEEWLEDEEYYEGIDDANRQELKAWRGKPLGQAVPVDEDKDDRGSTIFLNITRPYVDAVSAKVADMLVPTDDRSYSIKPTPIPELLAISKREIDKETRRDILLESPTDTEAQDKKTEKIILDAKETLKAAKDSAKKAEDQIWDWHVESQYHNHNRRLIEDAAKVGTGILKGPIPTKKTKTVFRDGEIQQISDIKPASVRIFYRNFFPDPACGENIQNGNYTWERDDITRHSLSRLIGARGYITSQIQRCIQEGPQEATKEFREDMDNPGLKSTTEAKRSMFEIWYHYGSMKRSDLLLLDLMSGKTPEDEGTHSKDSYEEWVSIHLIMVNNRVIKATLSHMESGDFPYDVMIWQRRIGMPWGIGVARQIRAPQRMVVGASRHMLDNAGIAGGPMLFLDTTVIEAADGVNEIRPWKIWMAAEEYESSGADKKNIREAIQFLTAPMLQAELQAIIELALKLAEDVTGLPMIMRGQTNQQTPTTLGGMQIQNSNASTVLRRVAKLYDDLITTPHIRRYYDYILQYHEDDSLKGEFNVNALGSSTLVERNTADAAVIQLGQFVREPIFGKDPKKWINEMLKINKLNPERFDYEDEEWQRIVEQLSQPTADPRVEIAQLKAESDQQIAQFKAQTEAELLQLKAQETDRERMYKSQVLQLEKEFEQYVSELKEKGSSARNLDNIKQRIQDTVMKMKTQIALSGTEVTTPPVEPRGRAPDGQSFTK
jgi:hypothetical protein